MRHGAGSSDIIDPKSAAHNRGTVILLIDHFEGQPMTDRTESTPRPSNIAPAFSETSLGSLHHVTAIASDAATNIHFYSQILGLRLVKKTVNFDDPGSYHLYYGDYYGSPGSLITFFIWPGTRPLLQYRSIISAVGFAIPGGSTEWWRKHLKSHGIALSESPDWESRLEFFDPDGLPLYLTESQDAPPESLMDASRSGIIRLAGIEWSSRRPDKTTNVFTQLLKYKPIKPSMTDVLISADQRTKIIFHRADESQRSRFAPGQIHHAAFRASDHKEQADIAESLRARGIDVTPVRARKYFDSVYFMEPSGGICEIATDGPGMIVDEPLQSLGTHLCLPGNLESQRAEITAGLPPLEI
jgi:glyoxalase family protein